MHYYESEMHFDFALSLLLYYYKYNNVCCDLLEETEGEMKPQ